MILWDSHPFAEEGAEDAPPKRLVEPKPRKCITVGCSREQQPGFPFCIWCLADEIEEEAKGLEPHLRNRHHSTSDRFCLPPAALLIGVAAWGALFLLACQIHDWWNH